MSKSNWRVSSAILTAIALAISTGAFAQEEQSLANKTANPLGGDFILLINQYDFIVKNGDLLDQSVNPLAPSDAYANAYTFQPVISAPLDKYFGPGYSLVVRPTFQYLFDTDIPSTPTPGGIPFISGDGWADPSIFALIGKTTPTTFGGGGVTVIGAGVAASFPWGSDEFSSDQYTLGPTAVATYIGKHFVAGGLAQQFWSVADDGNSSAPDVNKTLLQYFYYYNITPSLQLGASPLATLDYENDLYQFPLNLGLTYTGQIFGENKPPFKVGFEVGTYVGSSDSFGNDWGVKVFLIPILPSPIKKLFPGLYE